MERLLRTVQYLKGVGPRRSELLGRLGIESIFDLLWYVPRAYFNRTKIESISSLEEGTLVNIRGIVANLMNGRSARGMYVLKAMIQDDSGMIPAVWFNQPYLSRTLKEGQMLFISGRLKFTGHSREFYVAEFEVLEGEEMEQKVIPIYSITEGLNQKVIRNLMLSVLSTELYFYPEILSSEIQMQYGLCDIQTAFKNIHFPESREKYVKARRRLAFEEILLFRLSLFLDQKADDSREAFVEHREQKGLFQKMKQQVPFTLTTAQEIALHTIVADMKAPRQMNRLLQGDVGSGKTVVSMLAMALAVDGGYQAAIMAPTEILALQHHESIAQFFSHTDVSVACLTGGTSSAERKLILEAAASGKLDILIGTHALIQDDLRFKRLGLAVIDEQHRFGVKQRANLSNKGELPDVLVMTATPIPRTLALTVYGDLDLSVMNERPPGRKSIKTIFVKQGAREQAFYFLRNEIEKGRQVYVVCPLVEESEKQDLQDAVSLYHELKTDLFSDYQVGLIHGRMSSREKESIMRQFKDHFIQILVSTTVIEVGVDVPNASTILIVHAERFGLAQLHQLRGRVGRGSAQSYCILLGNPGTKEAQQRIRAMEQIDDGFKLANEDLAIRGPGDFWGIKQHGLDELKVANLVRDQKIIEQVSGLDQQLQLEIAANSLIRSYVNAKFKKSAEIARN